MLTLNLQGVKAGELFAGDGRRYTRSASAFFYGSDPNHYYENRGGAGRLTLQAVPAAGSVCRGRILRAPDPGAAH